MVSFRIHPSIVNERFFDTSAVSSRAETPRVVLSPARRTHRPRARARFCRARLGRRRALRRIGAGSRTKPSRDIVALGRRAVALQADLGVEAQVARLVPACIEALGRVCIALSTTHRASTKTRRSDFGYAQLLEMTAINLGAPLALARALYEATPDAAADDETPARRA